MNNSVTFSLLYATARHHEVPATIRRWFKSADARWDTEIVIVTDGGQWKGEWDGTVAKLCVELKIRQNQIKCRAVTEPPLTCNRAWNRAARESTGKILVVVADDLEPCADWDYKILKALDDANKQIDEPWVIWADDGSPDKKMTHAILSRTRYESEGYLFYPHFRSQYDDTLLWKKAERDGIVIDARSTILIDHIHPAFKKRPSDAVDAVQSGSNRVAESRRLYEWLIARDFPPPSGLVPKGPQDYCAYFQVIKDDLFLFQVMERLVEEGVTKFFIHTPTISWCGEPITNNDIAGMHRVFTALMSKYGCDIRQEFHPAIPIRGERRIETEGRVRNAALSSMRSMGWHFALIVDSDELWVKGTLAKIHALAKEGVQCVRMKMTTVAGMPPNCFPIDGIDCANMYIGPDTEFSMCREPVAPQHLISEVGIYHFTAVRRTKELLAQNMKENQPLRRP